MPKTILVTGSTDGIGLEAAKELLRQGHRVLLHGRNPQKLTKVTAELAILGDAEGYVADFSDINAVKELAKEVSRYHNTLDVLINNAGILKTPDSITKDGLDVRFVVNTIAPYVLTKLLLPILNSGGRVINVASSAQASVNLEALMGQSKALGTMEAYAQSKLAITMWTFAVAHALGSDGPVLVAVHPGAMLGSKMVREAFNTMGNDIRIGADILVRAALSDEFANASGMYFNNDTNKFTNPHNDAFDIKKCKMIISCIENVVDGL